MNWYKKAQKQLTLEDLQWAIDDIWLNEIFTEEDIQNILNENLNILMSNQENINQYQQKAAQVKTKSQNEQKINEELEKQKESLYLDERLGVPNIAKRLNIDPKIVKEFIQKNNIKLNKLTLQRRQYAERIVVDFVSNLPEDIPNIKTAYNMFTEKYNHSIKFKAFNFMLSYNNQLRNWGHKSNKIFDAFNKFINQNYAGTQRDVIGTGKYLEILDTFLSRYGDKFGFVSPMDKEMAKKFFMTKIQLRDLYKEYRNTGKFYNQDLNDNEKNRILELINKGFTPQRISRETGIKIDEVNKIYQIYQLRHSPIATDESHPSYFLDEQEK